MQIAQLRWLADDAYHLTRYKIIRYPMSGVRFVIFGRGRSGSTTLVSLLDALPGVRCEDEILRRPVLLPRAYVRERCARSRSPVYGCKILSYQVRQVQPLWHREDFIRQLGQDGFRIIYLKRENLVEHAVSNIRARQLGFRRQAESSPAGGKIVVDPVEVIRWIRRSEQLDQFEAAALAGVPHLDLTYERDLAFESLHQATVLRICAFLRLPTGDLPSPQSAYKKVSPRALSDSVANYAELADVLDGTPYARHLH